MTNLLLIISYIFFCFCTYFIWILIHEFSHLIVANSLFGISKWKINIFPHKYKNTFRFASCHYLPLNAPMQKEMGLVCLAPRLPDLIAVFALMFTVYFSFPYNIFWFVFFGAGVIDLFVGLLGASEESDLIRASKALDVNPWIFRIIGFSCIFISLASTIYSFFIISRCW